MGAHAHVWDISGCTCTWEVWEVHMHVRGEGAHTCGWVGVSGFTCMWGFE